MASVGEKMVASAVRPELRQSAQPASPRTPTRAYSSNFSSPGAGFRQDEDVVVVEIGSRYIRAGFEGEASPQCCVSFGPESSRRVGDYRDWNVGACSRNYKLGAIDSWSQTHELWQLDLRQSDIGLFEDKLERALRDIYNKYLLTDAGNQRMVFVLPSLLPHPLLSSLLHLVFSRWNFSTIGLLPSPTMTTLAAGLRSALVVDVGWSETIVTSVYEYRETSTSRSTRAMKKVVEEMAKILYSSAQKTEVGKKPTKRANFDFAEEVVMRLAWCRGGNRGDQSDSSNTTEELVEVEMPPGSPEPVLRIPSSHFAKPADSALFASDISPSGLDDEELTVPLLVFKALTALPPDVRGICMSRIVFVGGGSRLLGLSRRVLDEVAALASQQGWSNVRGNLIAIVGEKLKESQEIYRQDPGRWQREQEEKARRKRLDAIQEDLEATIDRPHVDPSSPVEVEQPPQNVEPKEPNDLPAAAPAGAATEGTTVATPPLSETKPPASPERPPLNDIDLKLQTLQLKESRPPIQGVLREVDSLGAWAGASLLSSLKIRGLVEVDRDRFLQHGLAGAHREGETSVVPQRQSFAGGANLGKGGDRSSWTLAGWS